MIKIISLIKKPIYHRQLSYPLYRTFSLLKTNEDQTNLGNQIYIPPELRKIIIENKLSNLIGNNIMRPSIDDYRTFNLPPNCTVKQIYLAYYKHFKFLAFTSKTNAPKDDKLKTLEESYKRLIFEKMYNYDGLSTEEKSELIDLLKKQLNMLQVGAAKNSIERIIDAEDNDDFNYTQWPYYKLVLVIAWASFGLYSYYLED